MGMLSGRADSVEEYVKIWNAHIADTGTLMLAAGLSMEEYDYHMTMMKGWLKRAADRQKWDLEKGGNGARPSS